MLLNDESTATADWRYPPVETWKLLAPGWIEVKPVKAAEPVGGFWNILLLRQTEEVASSGGC